jgi:cytochrome c
MNSFEWNKVFGAALLAILIGLMAGFISGKLVSPHHLEKSVIAVEGVGVEVAAGAPAAPTGPADLTELLKTANAENGAKVARACAACHTFDKGGANKVGPNLFGIAGASHAHASGFAYSDAMKAMASKPWTDDDLNKFLYAPKDYAKGTKMAFAGVKKDADRADLIAYLKSLK